MVMSHGYVILLVGNNDLMYEYINEWINIDKKKYIYMYI